MPLLALDIGGANLKIADGRGFGLSQFFPLWKSPEGLAQALAELVERAPPAERLVAAMTGELADCYATKVDGVRAIVDALGQASGRRSVQIYLTDGTLATVERARDEPLLAAASNWHALAGFAARMLAGQTGLLFDVGSTTCDLIPLVAGRSAALGRTDPERLVTGEMVYTGVTRSPVCAVVRRLAWQGRDCPVAQELFSTTWDAYLIRGELPDEPDSRHTADGRPATQEFARQRLARQICADLDMVSASDVRAMADLIAAAQLEQLSQAARNVAGRLPEQARAVVTSGQGEFLARRVVEQVLPGTIRISLAERLGPKLSHVATAHALAVVACEQDAP